MVGERRRGGGIGWGLWVTIGTAAVVVAVVVPLQVLWLAPAASPRGDRGGWSRAVTRICAHALLFDGRHEIGTRAGAVAVARDIRASTNGRLVRIERLRAPAAGGELEGRWLSAERRLADAYARSYVRIFDVIEAASTPRERAREPRLLVRLLHSPDRLSLDASRLERQLQVPDCTGGTPVRRAEPAAP